MSISRIAWLSGVGAAAAAALPRTSGAQAVTLATPVRIGTSAAETYAQRRVAAALTEAGRWANQHPDASARIVARVAKIDLDVIHAEHRTIYGEHMRADDLQPQLDAAFKFGFLSRPVSAAEFLPR